MSGRHRAKGMRGTAAKAVRCVGVTCLALLTLVLFLVGTANASSTELSTTSADATVTGACSMTGRGVFPPFQTPSSRLAAASPFVGFR